MRTPLLIPCALAMASGLAAQLPTIMLTGYWPPTNEAVRQFSTDPQKNPAGWVGADWEGRGYDVVSYFPEFSPPNCGSCGAGFGDLTVDYQDTSQDFWAIADSVQPIAIITFSRGSFGTSWEVEMNQYNRTSWIPDYSAPTMPTPSPPDASVPAGHLRLSTLPVQGIVNDVLQSGLPVVPGICATGDGGGFLSEFIAYHGVWYQDIHKWPGDPAWCVSAGHIHVGTQVSWNTARAATEVSLRTLIAHVDAIRATTGCQADLGFQGPGNARFDVCGGALNHPGNVADMRVTDAAPSTLGILAFGTQSAPTPLLGGTAVPLPAFYLGTVAFDAQGEWYAPSSLLAPPTPMADVFAQVAYFDPLLPQGFGFTNALRIALQ